MSDVNWSKVETIIDKALDLPETERQAFVEKECKWSLELKNEVTLLLESITDSEGWLEDPQAYKQDFYNDISGDVEKLSTHSSLIGTKVGSYIIKEKIGEGGMGSVYLAQRSDRKFQHRVAIKIIRHSQATKENIQRFRREQRILAKLNHPGIAHLYDGGVTEEGFPYIIMEYVDGIPITQYCQQHNSSIRQKINLFKQVLEAVRNAHENLTIHRDLKPDNILIDESGNVKILDFGISKLLEDDEEDIQTKTGSRLLTPRYAAPEQIKQENITTATDLYSLGVIFYKLLTNSDPIDLENLTQYQAEQAILKQEPKKPSEDVSDPKLRKELKGDLDAIVLKSIRKEPESRYRVATNFINDLDNYHRGIPVAAREDSLNYRTQKFFKRHKQGISVAAGVILLLIAYTGFYTQRITEERNIAQLEAQKALLVKDLILDIFKANDPILAEQESATLPQLLESGTNRIRDNEINPEIRIELSLVLSSIYQNITEYDKARELADESLLLSTEHFGENSVNAAESFMQIGGIEHEMGSFSAGKNYFKKAQHILNEQLPESNPLFTELYSNLGHSEEQLGKYDSSRIHFQKALDIVLRQHPIDSANYIRELRNVARSHYRLDENSTGDSLLYLALNISEDFHGKNDIVTSSVLNDLGLYSMTQAKYDSARSHFNRSLGIKNNVYGSKGHPNYSATLTNLAVLEETFSNFELAESLYTEALNMDLELFGENHPNVAISKNHLASIAFKKGEYENSKILLEEALQMYIDIYGAEHNYLGSINQSYGELLSTLGEYEQAAEYFVKADSIFSNNKFSSNRDFASLYRLKGENYFYLGEFVNASQHFEEAIWHYEKLSHPYFAIPAVKCGIKLGESLIELGETDQAKSIFTELQTKIDSTENLANNTEILELYSQVKRKLQP